MRNILLTIQYDGAGYHGWQRQPDLATVQGTIEETLGKLLREDNAPIPIEGTGRTDAGVHALGQCATLQLPDGGIPTERLAFALTNALPPDIDIVSAREVPAGFHARFDAVGKTYRYKLLSSDHHDLFRRRYYYQIGPGIDLTAMRRAAEVMEGTHDFKAFQATGGEEKESTVRTVKSIDISTDGEEIDIAVTGDGFLYNMVRIMVGTLVEVGFGRIDADEIGAIIAGCDRTRAGHTAPAHGLYLERVYFPDEIGYTGK